MTTTTKTKDAAISSVSRSAAILRALLEGPTDGEGLVGRGAIKSGADCSTYIGSLKPHDSGVLTHEFWDSKARNPADTSYSLVTLRGRGLVVSTTKTIEGRKKRSIVFSLTAKGSKLAKSFGIPE